ncbi:MAG: hypothetical protein ABI216_22095 [Devosia sp.]
MATFKAVDLNYKALHMGGYGNCVVAWGAVTPTTGALNDVYIPLVIPGGLEVTDVDVVFSDMDTGSAMAVKVGYAPVNAADGPVANDSYFQSANTFISGTGGPKKLGFRPIKFEKPVFLTFTVSTAATTFASAELIAIVKGDGLGIK